MAKCLITAVAWFCLAANAAGGNWRTELKELLRAASVAAQDSLIGMIAAHRPTWRELAEEIQRIPFTDTATGRLLSGSLSCADSVTRPYAVFVPSSYNPGRRTPLLVHLHGIVMRPTIEPNPHSYIGHDTLLSLADERGWLVLFPFGQSGASWFDMVGIGNVTALVRMVKTHFNVDDNQVYLSGFSDGASGAFLFAMGRPDDFAAFVALNGSIGGGSADGEFSTYAPNLANTYLYITTAASDRYYPTSQFQRTVAMAEAAGARVLYRRLEGDHIGSEATIDYREIFDFLQQHPRNPRPDTLTWETAGSEFGRFRWLAIDEVTIDEPAAWHRDYNVALVDSSVSVGIQPDDSFSGTGVLVASLSHSDCIARSAGVRPGDLVIQGNGVPIASPADLTTFRGTLRRGDPAAMVVRRNDTELTLRGRVPPPRNYFIFARKQPSALAKATFANNFFDISGSRIGAFRLFIDPFMVDPTRNIVVRFNGRIIFNERVTPDIGYMLRQYLANRDRSLLFVAEITLEPGQE